MPIRRYASLAALGLAAFAVVLLLGRLPSAERQLNDRLSIVSVFEPETAGWLTDDRLVDAMAAIPLANRPLKVVWNHGILAVDLRNDQPDVLQRDLALLIDYAYADVRNVKQVLIRVFETRGERKTLLLAAETRKTDWTDDNLEKLSLWTGDLATAPPERWPNVRWTITSEGRRRLENFANS